MPEATALFAEAESAFLSRDWDEALAKYKKTLEADPCNGEACQQMAKVYAIRGQYNSVINSYEQLIEILENNGDLDGALQVASWVLKLDPGSERARAKIIRIFQRRGDVREVVNKSRELARLYIEKGEGDKSIALLQKAQQADPDNHDIGLELAEMYVSHGHIQEGANQYRKVANAFMNSGNPERAAEAFKRMKVIVPDDPGVLLKLGNLYVELGKYNEAEQEYRSILRHNLSHEEALLALGKVCQLKGQFRDAILAFNKILSINPGEITAKEKLGELYQAQGLIEESIKNFLAAAQAYLEIDERDRAIRLYQLVLGMDQSNPIACRELTNLGAPLEAIKPEPLKPVHVEEEPEPAPAGIAAGDESKSGLVIRQQPGEGPTPKRVGLLRPSEGPAAPGMKSGLLSSKLGAGKPSLGGKPALGGGGASPRAGLLRPGGAGDKPMLLRRTLDRPAEEEAREPESFAPSMPISQAPASELPSAAPPEPQPQPREEAWSPGLPIAPEALAPPSQEPAAWQEPAAAQWEQPAAPAADAPWSGGGDWTQPSAEPQWDKPGAQWADQGSSGAGWGNETTFAPPPPPSKGPSLRQKLGQSAPEEPLPGLRPGLPSPFDKASTEAEALAPEAGSPSFEGTEPALPSAGLFTPRTGEEAMTPPPSGAGGLFGGALAERPEAAFDAQDSNRELFGSAEAPPAAAPGLFGTTAAAEPSQDFFGAGQTAAGDLFGSVTAAAPEPAPAYPGPEAYAPAHDDYFGSAQTVPEETGAPQQAFPSAPSAGFDRPAPHDDLFGASPAQAAASQDFAPVAPAQEDFFGAGAGAAAAVPPANDFFAEGSTASAPGPFFGFEDQTAPPTGTGSPVAPVRDHFFGDAAQTVPTPADFIGSGTPAAPAQAEFFSSEAAAAPAPADFFSQEAPAAHAQADFFGSGAPAATTQADFFASEAPAAPPVQSDFFASEAPAAPAAGDFFGSGAPTAPAQADFPGSGIPAAPSHADFFGSGTQAAPTPDDFFGSAPQTAPAPDDFFSSAPQTAPAPDDFFGTTPQAAPAPDDFFGSAPQAAPAPDDFFGTTPQAAPAPDDFFSATPQAAPAPDDFFSSTPQAAPTPDDFFSSTPQAAPAPDDFFSSTSQAAPAPDDFFGSAPQAAPAQADFFSSGTPVIAAHDDLFGAATPSAPVHDDFFGSAPAAAVQDSGSTRAAPAHDDFFAATPAAQAQDDLFGSLTAAAPVQDDFVGAAGTVAPATPAQDDLFGGAGAPQDDLFGGAFAPIPADQDLFGGAQDDLFSAAPATAVAHGDLFAPENEPFPPAADQPPAIEKGLFEAGAVDLFAPAPVEHAPGGFAPSNALFAPPPAAAGDLFGQAPAAADPFASSVAAPAATAADLFGTAAEPLPMAPPQPSGELFPPSPADQVLVPPPPPELFAGADALPSPASHEAPMALALEPPMPAAPLEPAPAPEPRVLGVPRVSLSIEEESPREDVARAGEIRGSIRQADVATSISVYRKAIEESPDNLVLRTDLADIHLKYGLLEDAVVQYRQIIKRNPESISLRHRLVQAHLWNDNLAEAANTIMELAELHTERGEHQDALDALQTVLSLNPHHFEARRKLVDRFTALGQSKLAAHHLRQLAEAALTKGSVEEAILAFQQLMEISDDPSFQERLAQVYENQRNTERALHYYCQLVERYRAEQKWEQAAEATERIADLDPENLDTRQGLIELYQRLGLNEKVRRQQFELARSHHELGSLEQAIRLYETVLLEQPDHHRARRLLVDAYLGNHNVAAAIAHSEALTEHYLSTQDHATAIELYRRLGEADPQNVELRERLIKFYNMAEDSVNAMEQQLVLAEQHKSAERYAQAVDAYHRALELDESRVDLHYEVACLYLERLDNPAGALEQFQRIFELQPGHMEAMERYIRMLLKMGRAGEAADVLKQLEKSNESGRKVRLSLLGEFRDRIEQEPGDLMVRFTYGELCYNLGELDLAIEQFQQTRRDPAFELKSYNMLGLCFAEKTGFNMLDLAIKQFRKGLETRGHSDQEYLELKYNLAMLQYRNNRLQEALQELKDCYAVDIAFKDVREWIRRIESEIAGGPKVTRLFPREK